MEHGQHTYGKYLIFSHVLRWNERFYSVGHILNGFITIYYYNNMYERNCWICFSVTRAQESVKINNTSVRCINPINPIQKQIQDFAHRQVVVVLFYFYFCY